MSGFKLLDESLRRAAPEMAPGRSAVDHDQPLGLTVYALPEPQRVLDRNARRAGRGRWQMLAVFLVCAAPVLASYFTYYVVRPQGRRNYGELIEPQRPLPDLASISLSGQQGSLQALRGQWLLLSVAGGACDEVCHRHLYLQRQLRESLGKDKDRLDWVWLVADDVAVSDKLRPALKEATVLRVAAAGLATWLSPAPGHQLQEHLYLVDPMGNWMMRFPAAPGGANATNVKRDLERVLRASASWDQPGRQVAR